MLRPKSMKKYCVIQGLAGIQGHLFIKPGQWPDSAHVPYVDPWGETWWFLSCDKKPSPSQALPFCACLYVSWKPNFRNTEFLKIGFWFQICKLGVSLILALMATGLCTTTWPHCRYHRKGYACSPDTIGKYFTRRFNGSSMQRRNWGRLMKQIQAVFS